MTDREAMKMVLELLKQLSSDLWMGNRPDKVDRTILALEVALAQPEQEPFGYFQLDLRMDAWVQNRTAKKGVAFYTAPPSKQDINQELVEALKEIVFETANGSTAQRIAQAAIAKAEEQA